MLPEQYTRWDDVAFANFVAAISRTNSNQFEFMRLIAATMIFTKNHCVTRGELLGQVIPVTCRSDLSPSVSRP